jgi:hypothetical protein
LKSRKEEGKPADSHNAKKPRFTIDKLEERIAPRNCSAVYQNPHGKWVGPTWGCYR